ncbi:phage tail tube protein [Desulfovibrio sp.]
MTQESGSLTRTYMAFEESFNTLPAVVKGYVIPVTDNKLAGQQEQSASKVLSGHVDATAPDRGNLNVAGDINVPVDAHSFGLHLRHMFLLPVSSVVAAKALANGAVADKGSGKVGIPCPAHGLAKGAPVVIEGTTHYDGAHVLQPETGPDELVILAPYTAEAVADTDTVTLARRITLDAGAVTDKGGGLVGLPCAGHGLPVGAEITVAGTTNYDGTYTLKRGTGPGEIVIAATFAAEVLAGDETVTARFWDHVFKVTNAQTQSAAFEREFPSIPAVFRNGGVKADQCKLTIGGSGEIIAAMTELGAGESAPPALMDPAPVRFPLHKFSQFHASLSVDGVDVRGRFTELALTLNLNQAGEFTIGDQGRLGDISRGVMESGGTLTGLFKDTAYADKALLQTRLAVGLRLVNGGYALGLLFPEAELSRATPPVEGPQGVKETYTITCFRDVNAAESSLVITLRNEIKTWTE